MDDFLIVGYLVVVVFLLTRVAIRRSLWIALASHAVQILLAMTLLGCRQGTSIRPMGLALLLFVPPVTSLIVGVPLSAKDLRARGTRRSGMIGMVLNLTPLVTGIVAMEVVAYLWNLHLES